MIPIATALLIGFLLGLYVGNKTLRERVNKDAKKLYNQLTREKKEAK